jgi:hypothetical protein
MPPNPDADIIIADPRLSENLSKGFRRPYFGPSTGGLRPGVLRAVYVEQSLWDAYISSRSESRAR